MVDEKVQAGQVSDPGSWRQAPRWEPIYNRGQKFVNYLKLSAPKRAGGLASCWRMTLLASPYESSETGSMLIIIWTTPSAVTDRVRRMLCPIRFQPSKHSQRLITPKRGFGPPEFPFQEACEKCLLRGQRCILRQLKLIYIFSVCVVLEQYYLLFFDFFFPFLAAGPFFARFLKSPSRSSPILLRFPERPPRTGCAVSFLICNTPPLNVPSEAFNPLSPSFLFPFLAARFLAAPVPLIRTMPLATS
jgi:hypothetical protein